MVYQGVAMNSMPVHDINGQHDIREMSPSSTSKNENECGTEKSSKSEKKKKKKDKKEKKGKSKDPPSSTNNGEFEDLFRNRNSHNPDEWAMFDNSSVEWSRQDGGAPHGQPQGSVASSRASDQSRESGRLSVVPSQDDSAGVAQFHSEMLEGFLKRNGHDEALALATAAAFQNFLKDQDNVMEQLNGGDASIPTEDDEEARLEALETLGDDTMLDSFAPDSIWDEAYGPGDKAAMMAEYLREDEYQYRRPAAAARPVVPARVPMGSRKDPPPPPPKAISQEQDFFDEKALMMSEYMQSQRSVAQKPNQPGGAEDENLANFHGERLQSFLQRHGKGDEVAVETAAAFQEFLSRQTDALGKLTVSASPNSAIAREAMMNDLSLDRSYKSEGPSPLERKLPFDARMSPGSTWSDPTRRTFSEPTLRYKSSPSLGSEGSAGRKTRNHLLKVQNHASPAGPHELYQDHSSRSVRSAPVHRDRERSIQEQLSTLTVGQIACLEQIRKSGKGVFSDEWYLRFARCCDFKAQSAIKVMKKFDQRYLRFSIATLETAMQGRMIYPMPGVVGRGGIDMLYMNFGRLIPGNTSVAAFADHLIYVLNCMHEKEAACVNGVGVIADLTNLSMGNFSVPYISKFLMILQGRQIPVKVEALLFVNPPNWFGKLSGVMRPMMRTDFAKTKVHKVTFHDLVRIHLQPGSVDHLSSDVFVGRKQSGLIVAEFIEHRRRIEAHKILHGVR